MIWNRKSGILEIKSPLFLLIFMNFPLLKMKKKQQFLGLYWDVHWVIYYRYSHPELSQGNLLLLRFEKNRSFCFQTKIHRKIFYANFKCWKSVICSELLRKNRPN